MSNKLIRKLIETRLNTWATTRSPAIQVAYENTQFTIPASAYLRGFLLPAETGSDDLAGDHRRYMGIYQISIYSLINGGAGPAESIAVELEALFPNALVLTDGTFSMQVVSAVSSGRPDSAADRYMLPVSFRYRADKTV